MDDLSARLDTLEIAINQLAGLLLKPMEELGDVSGHPFHGNQYGAPHEDVADRYRAESSAALKANDFSPGRQKAVNVASAAATGANRVKDMINHDASEQDIRDHIGQHEAAIRDLEKTRAFDGSPNNPLHAERGYVRGARDVMNSWLHS